MTDTPITSLDDVETIIAATIREERGRERPSASSTVDDPPANQPGPPKADPIATSDHQIGLSLLVEASDGDREKAIAALAADPQAIGRLGDAIKQRRAALQAEADEAARIAYENSPTGRQAKAKAVAEANAEQKRLALYARELLLEEGETPADLVESITDEEAIELARLREPEPKGYRMPEPTPDEAAAKELRRTWFQKAAPQRREFAEEHNISSETFEAIAADAASQTDPNIWQ
jgi:hypothetical protein